MNIVLTVCLVSIGMNVPNVLAVQSHRQIFLAEYDPGKVGTGGAEDTGSRFGIVGTA
ncbi:MAG: hypothetical protein ACFBSC_14510 [Microcoleaceae cyanobacterium]